MNNGCGLRPNSLLQAPVSQRYSVMPECFVSDCTHTSNGSCSLFRFPEM